MIQFDMSAAERKDFIDKARQELVDRLYNELAEDVQTVSKARLAGLLDVDVKTLENMGIPRIVFTAKKCVKYSLRSVAEWLQSKEEK